MKHFRKQFTEAREKGQSLVEVALFFPIFLVILAGVVEVSHLVITQNRVSNAARSSTRFGANGGEDAGMVNVALNTVTQTLEVSDDVWDIWSIRGTLNEAGDNFAEWEFTQIYGISNTTRAASVNEEELRQRVIGELQIDHQGQTSTDIAGGLRIVGTYAIHDVESILGLEAMPALVGFNSVSALSVMRVTGLNIEQTNGCTGFPIAVEEGIRSLTDVDGGNPYPAASDFDYPSNPPSYASFTNNVPQIPLRQAQEGYVYKVQQGTGRGNFGWLRWNQGISANANTLRNSLGWPGDSDDYNDYGDGGQPVAGAGYPHVVRGYVEPGDPTDQTLHIDDWVAANTGSVNSVGTDSGPNNPSPLRQSIGYGRTLRLLVWRYDENNPSQNPGVNERYQIIGFVIMRLHGFKLDQSQGGSWILAEFVRWDDSCGQVPATPQ